MGLARFGDDNVLVDSREDKVAEFEKVTIVDARGAAKLLVEEVPSIAGLAENFRRQACRVRVFVNLDVLKPAYQSKEERLRVGDTIRQIVEGGG